MFRILHCLSFERHKKLDTLTGYPAAKKNTKKFNLPHHRKWVGNLHAIKNLNLTIRSISFGTTLDLVYKIVRVIFAQIYPAENGNIILSVPKAAINRVTNSKPLTSKLSKK